MSHKPNFTDLMNLNLKRLFTTLISRDSSELVLQGAKFQKQWIHRIFQMVYYFNGKTNRQLKMRKEHFCHIIPFSSGKDIHIH